MGTYLSTPVTEKAEESGESLDCPEVPCAWGVVDMQGWRKTMEDAHVAATNIPLDMNGSAIEGEAASSSSLSSSDAKVFGVFDGHGGSEVAHLCGLYLVSVLTQQDAWKDGKNLITLPEGVKYLDGEKAKNSNVGKALRSAFHALDRMVDDANRREELLILRTQKPPTGERREALSIPASQTSNSGQKTAETGENSEVNEVNAQVSRTNESNDEASTKDDDDDSTEAVGKEEAAKIDQDMMMDNAEDREAEEEILAANPTEPTKVTALFQKILSLGAQSGTAVINADEGSANDISTTTTTNTTGPSASQPTLVHNGRVVCNLPEHPIHAGATAIVAVVTGKVLTVANAGDSRAVLGRANGVTLPLSFDHKPQNEVETNRITKAGGFVNQFGRINGNLNLSRSIGDLKYKQVPGIPPEEQIITAEPDIIQVILEPDDEFIILGCDGIWDCLTNENAVKYVGDRIDSKSPTDIGKEMLDNIISEDPRVTQGIGGDNMTIMIIDLQPSTRSWRTNPSFSGPTTDVEPIEEKTTE